MKDDVLRTKSRQLLSEVILHWSELTPEDVHGFDGGRDFLIGLLESRYGFTRRRAERETEWFLSKFTDKIRNAS